MNDNSNIPDQVQIEALISHIGLGYINQLNDNVDPKVMRNRREYLAVFANTVTEFLEVIAYDVKMAFDPPPDLPADRLCDILYYIEGETRDVDCNPVNRGHFESQKSKHSQQNVYHFRVDGQDPDTEPLEAIVLEILVPGYELTQYEQTAIFIMLQIICKHIEVVSQYKQKERLKERELKNLNFEKELREKELEIQKNEADFQKRIAGETAHKIKTPISLIAMWLADIKREIAKHKIPSEWFDKYITKIENGLKSAEETVSRLLVYERRVETEKLKIGVNTLIESIVENFPSIEDHFDLSVKLLETDRLILISSDDICHAFNELLTNAMKYGKPNGKLEIEVSYIEASNSVIISTRNEGRGISYDKKEILFNPAKRMAGTGTGYGLLLAQSLIASNNGKIELGPNSSFSDNNDGWAEFIITFSAC